MHGIEETLLLTDKLLILIIDPTIDSLDFSYFHGKLDSEDMRREKVWNIRNVVLAIFRGSNEFLRLSLQEYLRKCRKTNLLWFIKCMGMCTLECTVLSFGNWEVAVQIEVEANIFKLSLVRYNVA